MLEYRYQNSSAQAFSSYVSQAIEMENGFLVVRAVTRDGNPLTNATVRIIGEDNKSISKVVKTDANGKTESVTLPAPARKYSLSETSIILPYSKYTVRVEYTGYYTNVYEHEQIFARTLTEQTSVMIPLPKGVKGAPEKIYEIPEHPLAR